MTDEASVLLGALAVDLVFGEPPGAVHPVVWMGKLQTAAVQKALPPWNVSAAAQAGGAVAVRLGSTLGPGIRTQIAGLRRALERSLLGVAGAPERSGGPFLFYRAPNASTLATRLLSLGVSVRSCASFGLPENLRVGVRTDADNPRLATAWRIAVSPKR